MSLSTVLTAGIVTTVALAVVISPAARADDSESTQAPDYDSSVIGRTLRPLAPDGPPIRLAPDGPPIRIGVSPLGPAGSRIRLGVRPLAPDGPPIRVVIGDRPAGQP